MTQQGITDHLNARRPYKLSKTTINADIAELVERWQSEMVSNTDAAKAVELALINEVQAEAFAGYTRSRSEKTKESKSQQERPFVERGATKAGKVTTKVVTKKLQKLSMETEHRDGNPEFLRIILKCSEDRRRLLGLDAPVKVNPVFPAAGEGGGDGVVAGVLLLPAIGSAD